MQPLVTVITPTANRPEMLKRCIEQFMAQGYQNKEMYIGCNSEYEVSYMQAYFSDKAEGYMPVYMKSWDIEKTTGDKRNELIHLSDGEIILHMDDDDYYAPDWISKSVQFLLDNDADLVGLNKGYFWQPNHALRWYERKANQQPFVLGATMCYKKSMWERNKFQPIRIGEDKKFCVGAGKVMAHDYVNGFMCIIHGNNTSSQEAFKVMKGLNPLKAKEVLGDNYERFI